MNTNKKLNGIALCVIFSTSALTAHCVGLSNQVQSLKQTNVQLQGQMHQLKEDNMEQHASIESAIQAGDQALLDLINELKAKQQEQEAVIGTLEVSMAELSQTPAPVVEEVEPSLATPSSDYQGNFRISFYDTSANSQEGWGYMTASGVSLQGKNIYDKLIACPPEYELGSMLQLNFDTTPELSGQYTCVDRGGAIKGNKIDVFFEDYNMEGTAFDLGIKYADVYLIN